MARFFISFVLTLFPCAVFRCCCVVFLHSYCSDYFYIICILVTFDLIYNSRSCGVFAAVELFSAGFPNKFSFHHFLNRFFVLSIAARTAVRGAFGESVLPEGLPSVEETLEQQKLIAKEIMELAAISSKLYAIGKTRMYLRGSALSLLRAADNERKTWVAVHPFSVLLCFLI